MNGELYNFYLISVTTNIFTINMNTNIYIFNGYYYSYISQSMVYYSKNNIGHLQKILRFIFDYLHKFSLICTNIIY